MTREERLVLLIEECGEVIQAATKCLRFGYDHNWPGYGVNSEVLAQEVGDLFGAAESLGLNEGIVEHFRQSKMAKAEKWKEYIATRSRET